MGYVKNLLSHGFSTRNNQSANKTVSKTKIVKNQQDKTIKFHP